MDATLTLTSDQETAYKAILDFLASDARTMVLEGYAGTGKTTLMALLVSEREDLRISVTAPTHKAVAVLRAKVPTASLSTIHSLLKLRVKDLPDGTQTCLPEDPLFSLVGVDLLIVDECSMLGSDLLDYIFQRSGEAKILFVGDPAQLPPVSREGSVSSPVFSLASRKAVLSRIVRQAQDNPILALSAKIRTWIEEGHLPSISDIESALPEGPSKAGLMSGDISHAVAFEHQEGRDTRILCFTNARVMDYNRRIHEILHPGSPFPFVQGQTVVFQSEHESPLNRRTIRNNEEVVIVSISEETHPKWEMIPAWKVVVRQPEHGDLTVFAPKHPLALQNTIKSLFQDYRRLTVDKKDRDCYAEGLASSTQAWALKKSFADMRATYAMTVHKSQGSTFHTVFVDWNDIMILAAHSRTDFLRMLYTAVTRPAEHLAICH